MRPWAWRTQLSIFFAAYVLYDAARWIFASDPDRARVHAEWIIDLERSVHVAVEGPVQSALGSGAPIWILSNVYLAAQLVVLPLSLIWLYRRSRPIYHALRNTVIATWLIAVPIFALFPVAPPRLAGIGIADTVSSQAGVGLTGRSTLFYNPFAAVPSLHFGYALLVGVTLGLVARNRIVRIIGWSYPVVMLIVIVGTGNHFFFDAAGGAVAIGVGFLAASWAGAPATHRKQRPTAPESAAAMC
jgi:hypothetical protein